MLPQARTMQRDWNEPRASNDTIASFMDDSSDIHASGGLPTRVRDLQHLVPMQRGGTADEVAQAIVWLLSSAASYTTMSLLDVSGGR